MPTDCITFRDTNYFSSLICDYLDENPDLRPFYNRFPTLENFKDQIDEKQSSFKSETNASKLVGILRAKGYDAQRAGLSRKGLFAVAYFSTHDKEEALINLAMIRRDDNPSAWLLKK